MSFQSTGVFSIALAVAITAVGCQQITGQADRDLPAGSCVVFVEDFDNGDSMDQVTCSSSPTHFVTGTAARDQCPDGTDAQMSTIVEAGRVYCLRLVSPESPAP